MKKNNWQLDKIIEGLFVVLIILFAVSLIVSNDNVQLGVSYLLIALWFLMYISARETYKRWRDLYYTLRTTHDEVCKTYEEALKDMGENNKLLAGQIAKYRQREKETDQSS